MEMAEPIHAGESMVELGDFRFARSISEYKLGDMAHGLRGAWAYLLIGPRAAYRLHCSPKR